MRMEILNRELITSALLAFILCPVLCEEWYVGSDGVQTFFNLTENTMRINSQIHVHTFNYSGIDQKLIITQYNGSEIISTVVKTCHHLTNDDLGPSILNPSVLDKFPPSIPLSPVNETKIDELNTKDTDPEPEPTMDPTRVTIPVMDHGTNISIDTHLVSGLGKDMAYRSTGIESDDDGFTWYDPRAVFSIGRKVRSLTEQSVIEYLSSGDSGDRLTPTIGEVRRIRRQVQDDLYQSVRVRAYKSALLMSRLIIDNTRYPSPHCYRHHHIKNVVTCFNTHYTYLLNSKRFTLIMALFGEFLTLSSKAEVLRPKHKS